MNSHYLRCMRVIVVVSNDLCTDQRVQKVCNSLQKLGHSVTLVGRLLPNSLALKLPYKTVRFNLLFNRGPLFYLTLNLRLLWYLMFVRCEAIHANDLDTLLPAWIASSLRRKKLVYDTHEYFTGVPELQKRPVVKKIWELIESLIFPRLTRIITVNDSIANLYRNRYKVNDIKVMRNIPNAHVEIVENPAFTKIFPAGKFKIILQGNGINLDRGAEEAVEMMKFLNDAILIIAGNGDVIEQLKATVEEQQLQAKVIFMPRMPYNELLGLTQMCDLGLTLDKDTNMNYRFSLPNKLFDYLRAGIPVLASDLPEVRKIIESYKTGWIVEKVEPKILADQVKKIIHSPELYQSIKLSLSEASNELSWEVESRVLNNWY